MEKRINTIYNSMHTGKKFISLVKIAKTQKTTRD